MKCGPKHFNYDGFCYICLDQESCPWLADTENEGNEEEPSGTGSTVGIVIGVLLGIAVVVGLVFFARWYRTKQLQKIREGGVVLDETLSANIEPNRLSFGGNQLEPGVAAEDVMYVENTNNFPIELVLYDETDSEEYTLRWGVSQQQIQPHARIGVVARLTLKYNTTVQSVAKFSVHEKENHGHGKRMEIPIVAIGKASENIHLKELTRGEELGSGTFGSVFKGKYMNIDVAIKYLNGHNSHAIEEFKREVSTMKQVKGKNIVRFYGAVLEDPCYCHVTELMDLGSLAHVMKSNKVDTHLKVKMFMDIAVGMETIHAFNIIHRDLKPENVLCCSPLSVSNSELCKITDFGTSRGIADTLSLTMTKGQGTPLYMAPEILRGQTHYDKTVDVFSYGILMAFVWNNGVQPYIEHSDKGTVMIQHMVIEGTRPKITVECPEDLMHVMESCWSNDPAQRRGFNEIAEYMSQLFRYFQTGH